METVLLVVHLLIVAALVGVVLVQRSEGGALGIGGGGNFMATRGTGNVLTRATTYLGVAFFITSIVLTVLAQMNSTSGSILNDVPADTIPDNVERPVGNTNILDLIGAPPREPAATTETPAPAEGAAVPEAAPAAELAPAAEAVPAAEPAAVPAAGDAAAPAATPAPATP